MPHFLRFISISKAKVEILGESKCQLDINFIQIPCYFLPVAPSVVAKVHVFSKSSSPLGFAACLSKNFLASCAYYLQSVNTRRAKLYGIHVGNQMPAPKIIMGFKYSRNSLHIIIKYGIKFAWFKQMYYLCTCKGVVWRNGMQNVETRTVAKSLPRFWETSVKHVKIGRLRGFYKKNVYLCTHKTENSNL